jgi:UDP-N-acetylglucosamine 2-epimerase (non-hydrolysing)
VIVIVFGTSAELIKLRPIIDDLRAKDEPCKILCTGQQYSQLIELPYFDELLSSKLNFEWLAKGYRGHSLTKAWQVIFWLLTCLRWTLKTCFSDGRSTYKTSVFLVHGDTMTTVVGSFIGRLMGATVAHVEAGLRSYDWRNPFPEEINRIITARFARIHFAPDDIAVSNLNNAKGLIVSTQGNTISDQVFRELGSQNPEPLRGSIMVLLHRHEFINDRKVIDETISALLTLSQNCSRMFIVLDAVARASIGVTELFIELSSKSTVEVSAKLDHKSFLQELLKCEFVITDSGGVQEEAAALGIPCIIHRVTSERMDGLGLGGTAVLTGLNSLNLLRFSKEPPPRKSIAKSRTSPTKLILEVLANKGYLTVNSWGD